MLPLHIVEFCLRHAIKDKWGPEVFVDLANVHIVEFNSFRVTNKEAVGGDFAKHARLGVGLLFFGRRERRLVLCSATFVIDSNVT